MFSSGYGENRIPNHINDTAIGEIAVFTTRFPNESEENRRIIGFFEIGNISGHTTKETTRVHADQGTQIRLPIFIVKELYFWAYYRNRNSILCEWGAHLFRYLDDGTIHRILYDISSTIKDLAQRDKINALILRKFGNAVPPPAIGVLDEALPERIIQTNKYGSGGEGPDHLELKLYVAQHPELIGLPRNSEHKVEHSFLSGDCVDILFTTPNGRKVVVEIETTTPMPGAHQVIKYRSLAAAQNNLSLDSNMIEGVLVAWSINNTVKAFCDFYEIEYYEIKPT